MSKKNRPTVFLVDDDPALGDSLRLLLKSDGISLVRFHSGQDFLEKYDPSQPGCVVLDIRMPGMSGLELQDKLVQQDLALPVLFLSGYADVPSVVRAIKAGALDFIEKPIQGEVFLDRVRQAFSVLEKMQKKQAERKKVAARVERLSRREKEVLEMILTGKSNTAIANSMGISRKTLDIHRARIKEKMQAKTMTDLVRMCLQTGEGVSKDGD